MTIEEFMGHLESVQEKWAVVELDGASSIVDYRGRKRRRQYIRAGCLCPITAVAGEVLGQLYEVHEADDAGAKLGLSQHDTAHIIDAADFTLYFPTIQVRRQLLSACGLKPEKEHL